MMEESKVNMENLEIMIEDLETMERVALALRQSGLDHKTVQVNSSFRRSLGFKINSVYRDAIRRLEEKYGEPIAEKDVFLQMWRQAWGDASYGFGKCVSPGLAVAYTVAVCCDCYSDVIAYINFKLAYHIENPSEVMRLDLESRHLAGADSKRRWEYTEKKKKGAE